MNRELKIKEALGLENPVFIDLRSPLEYSKGTIPGAVNIPLFDDREREIIGTTYKQDPGKARQQGIAFVSPKLSYILSSIEAQGQRGTPVLFCWRGGLRSKVLYHLLSSLGVEACRLEGGYKAFRRYVLERLESRSITKPVYVLHGLTGTGKTAVLKIMEEMGCPVLDLEGLAAHRGSLFGHLGIEQKRSQKDFDALLLKRLDDLDKAEYIVVEGEGKRIGPVYLPDFLFQALLKGRHILLTAPLEVRVQRILEQYTPHTGKDRQQVTEALSALGKYVGLQAIRTYQQLLHKGNYYELVWELCVNYYDRLYDDSNPNKRSFNYVLDSSNPHQAAEEIRQFIFKDRQKPVQADLQTCP